MGDQLSPQTEERVSVNATKIKVAYFAQAREYAGVSEEKFTLSTPASVLDLLSVVIAAHPGLSNIRGSLHFIVNGYEGTESSAEKMQLAEGDEIAILVPVVGG